MDGRQEDYVELGDGARAGRMDHVFKDLTAIRAAKARLEAAQRAADDARGQKPERKRNPKGGRYYKRRHGEPAETAQSKLTDPESSVMKTSAERYQQCYNAHAAVEGGNQLVVATAVTSSASDRRWCWRTRGAATKRTWRSWSRAAWTRAWRRAGWQEGDEGRREQPATCRMIEKLGTPEGRARYAERKWLSEAPNGWIKEVLGFRRFSVRGLKKVAGEWDLVCLALNVTRLGAHVAV